jgi:lipopolysaccharide/colanic/teichoic acid biosynthesis glycosyltransferase
MSWKRVIDVAIGVPALVAAAPLIGALAVLVRLDSPGPAFFAQTRVGRRNRPLRLFKLRTMSTGAAGPLVTAADDTRITRIGRVLRKTKLDELPQLLNVVKGEMSIVGPRPEAGRYVEQYRPEWLPLLDVRPGLTDLASIVFRDEEALLARARDRERAYVEAVMPAKLAVALEGVRRSSPLYDAGIVVRTVAAVLKVPGSGSHAALEQAAAAIEQLNGRG